MAVEKSSLFTVPKRRRHRGKPQAWSGDRKKGKCGHEALLQFPWEGRGEAG